MADTITAHSGNWIDSSMSRLGGEFAGILRVSAPKKNLAALEKALPDLAERDIDVTVHRDRSEPPQGGHKVRLSLTGLDHPGIVLEVSRALAGFNANIEELHTETFTGSMGGEAMFSVKANIALPDTLNTDQVRDVLEQIAQDIMVDIELEEATG
jgi:glycine cleavage system regulatory protein